MTRLYFSCFLIFVVNLQKEIEELRYNLENMSSTSDEGAQKLKEDYLQKLNVLESQVNLHFVCSSYQDYLLASILFNRLISITCSITISLCRLQC